MAKHSYEFKRFYFLAHEISRSVYYEPHQSLSRQTKHITPHIVLLCLNKTVFMIFFLTNNIFVGTTVYSLIVLNCGITSIK